MPKYSKWHFHKFLKARHRPKWRNTEAQCLKGVAAKWSSIAVQCGQWSSIVVLKPSTAHYNNFCLWRQFFLAT